MTRTVRPPFKQGRAHDGSTLCGPIAVQLELLIGKSPRQKHAVTTIPFIIPLAAD